MRFIVQYMGNDTEADVHYALKSFKHPCLLFSDNSADLCPVTDVEPDLIPLSDTSFRYWKTALYVKQQALNGKCFSGIIVTKNINSLTVVTKIHIDDYYGRSIGSRKDAADPREFIVHPNTFIRLAGFWKFARYFTLDDIAHWRKQNFAGQAVEAPVWVQWLLFNRLRLRYI